MSTTTITHLNSHTIHLDPVDQAIALLADSGLAGDIVCDGTCNGVSGCTVAPIGDLLTAA
jgi:hypothetical protein